MPSVLRRLLALAGTLSVCLAGPSIGPAAAGIPDTLCAAPAGLLRLAAKIPVVQQRAIVAGSRLTIAAFGSSSTEGYGASAPSLNYPAQLKVELERRYPRLDVHIHNLGVGGTVAADALDRMEEELPVISPDLVLWQVGTNDAIRNIDAAEFTATLDRGITMVRDSGADILLLPPQYAPAVVAAPALPVYLQAINRAAVRHRVGVFQRFEIMRGNPNGTKAMLIGDGLHQNDLGYRCLAQQLAASLTGDLE